ncbi:hypothetical protein [Clostridium sp. DJ247]|uniref:hypothetical protein n=1 Tax=Clostridium sp. DJ247 TaxID=2726188 RepID=UPI001628A2F8|nr:hypothetical protein [Clostridium sp. DJ247]MBC2578742.1 hypothetical protein [Clostridium sp. DJ247]
MIVFGFSKMLMKTQVVLDYSKKAGYKTILFTDLMVSEMLKMADISLYTYRGDLWEFHSMVSPLALLDCLIVGVALKMENTALKKLEDLSDIRKQYSDYIKR